MKLVIQFAIVFLVMLAITGQSVANADTIMHLAQKFSDDGYYSIDINSVDSLESVLRISCAEKCKSNLSYSETISGFFPRGAFGDGNTFTTLWSAGSAEWIIIYRIHSGTVTKVLQQPSRTLPDFEADPDGRKIIVLHNDTPGMYINKELYGEPHSLTRADRVKIRQETTSLWVWTGTTYVPYHGKVLAGWESIK